MLSGTTFYDFDLLFFLHRLDSIRYNHYDEYLQVLLKLSGEVGVALCKKGGGLVLGRDSRQSGPAILQAVREGAHALNCKVQLMRDGYFIHANKIRHLIFPLDSGHPPDKTT